MMAILDLVTANFDSDDVSVACWELETGPLARPSRLPWAMVRSSVAIGDLERRFDPRRGHG